MNVTLMEQWDAVELPAYVGSNAESILSFFGEGNLKWVKSEQNSLKTLPAGAFFLTEGPIKVKIPSIIGFDRSSSLILLPGFIYLCPNAVTFDSEIKKGEVWHAPVSPLDISSVEMNVECLKSNFICLSPNGTEPGFIAEFDKHNCLTKLQYFNGTLTLPLPKLECNGFEEMDYYDDRGHFEYRHGHLTFYNPFGEEGSSIAVNAQLCFLQLLIKVRSHGYSRGI